MQTSLLKIDKPDQIDHIQDIKKENQALRKQIEVLNARLIWYQNQMVASTGKY